MTYPSAPDPMPLGTSPSFFFAENLITQNYMLAPGARVIAQTNHSTVHRAYSGLFRREIAIKIIDKRSIPSAAVDKFLPRELEITKKVLHPHIVRCLHIYQPHPSKVVIVSEFYPGGTLLQYLIHRRIIDEGNAARLFRQLSEALHYLHDSLHVVHRDVKMENILISINGDVKLGDFGFAKYADKATRSTSFCGTQPYSSPQLLNHVPYDGFAADWFAAGIVLFTMLMGKWPFQMLGKSGHIEYPESCPISITARELCTKLLESSEEARFKYDDVIRNPWMIANTSGKWLMADDLFVYEF
uniref:Protein kinase domain-containing protein n=1 Tax=Panagrellus redivivus TaxID=6233 RepID=A0A7E4ZUS8_PANRE